MLSSFSFAWWNPNWGSREAITIDSSKIDEDLVDFPVLVRLNSSRINFSYLLADGADIRFVASDDLTALDYEIKDKKGIVIYPDRPLKGKYILT